MSGEAQERLVDRVAVWTGDHLVRAGVSAYDRREIARRAVGAMLSFDGLMAVAEQWLDEHYPSDVALVCDPGSPDPGPRLAAALRDCLGARS